VGVRGADGHPLPGRPWRYGDPGRERAAAGGAGDAASDAASDAVEPKRDEEPESFGRPEAEITALVSRLLAERLITG